MGIQILWWTTCTQAWTREWIKVSEAAACMDNLTPICRMEQCPSKWEMTAWFCLTVKEDSQVCTTWHTISHSSKWVKCQQEDTTCLKVMLEIICTVDQITTIITDSNSCMAAIICTKEAVDRWVVACEPVDATKDHKTEPNSTMEWTISTKISKTIWQ